MGTEIVAMKRLSILESGSREPLKATVHALSLCLVALMALYNAAAWVQRRKRHLAVNSVIYVAMILFEYQHVRHHAASPSTSAATAAALAAAAAASAAPDSVPLQRKAA